MKIKNLKKALIFLGVVLVAFMILFFENDFSAGAKYGIVLSLNTVIPSTFPFLILSAFACEVNAFSPIKRFLSPLFKKLFNLPPSSVPPVIFSFLGGYPAGAILSCSEVDRGNLSRDDLSKILSFCVMGSPTFIVGGVGKTFLHSTPLGFCLLIVSFLSNIFCGIIFCNLYKNKTPQKNISIKNPDIKNRGNILDGFINSVYKSAKNTLVICSYVVLFSAITSAFLKIVGENAITNIICAFLEVTGGVENALTFGGIPLVAGIITFGGFAVLLQIFSLIKGRINPIKFLLARLVASLFAFFLCKIVLIFYNPTVDVFSNINKADPKLWSVNPFMSIGLVFLSFFMIISTHRKKGKVDFSGDL